MYFARQWNGGVVAGECLMCRNKSGIENELFGGYNEIFEDKAV